MFERKQAYSCGVRRWRAVAWAFLMRNVLEGGIYGRDRNDRGEGKSHKTGSKGAE